MSDEPTEDEDVPQPADQADPADPSILLAWDQGDMLILNIATLAKRLDCLAVRTIAKTGDIEVLSSDGAEWRRLGRKLRVVK